MAKQARILTPTEYDSALSSVTAHRHPVRDRFVLVLSHLAGLRACEMSGLERRDLIGTRGDVLPWLTVRPEVGKNGEARRVPINDTLRREIVEYIAVYGAAIGADPRAQFIWSQKQAFTPNSMAVFCHRLFHRLGLDGCSSHSGRRAFLDTMKRRGVDLRTIQKLAGHADLSTTQAYLDTTDADLIDAVGRL